MLDPTKPITSTAAPAAATGVQALTAPNAAAAALPKTTGGLAQGLAPKAGVPAQVNDSVADKVKELTSQDSPLMQQAKTTGLKIANRRGLLNSSMAVGASQDAMVRTALPIASQDASQAFQKNMQSNDQTWKSGESALDRDLQSGMQDKDIASTEGMAKAQRELQERMQGIGIDADKQSQIRDIASREGLAAAERELQSMLQQNDINNQNFRQNQEIVSQQSMQQAEIGYQATQRGLDRGLQEQIASWNLKSADRNAAAQFATNMESLFQDSYSAIMANTALDAPTREKQIASARALRDRQMNLVQQMYNVSITW